MLSLSPPRQVSPSPSHFIICVHLRLSAVPNLGALASWRFNTPLYEFHRFRYTVCPERGTKIEPIPTRSRTMADICNVALIGQKFMGRAHSNAYIKAPKFFHNLARTPVMHTIAGRNREELAEFAGSWGWKHFTTNLKDVTGNKEIEFVDIGTPNNVHREHALMMLDAGKSVACEKPLAGTLDDARDMMNAAKKAKKQKTFVWYNYRRCPAVALAHQMVAGGKLGKVYHVRAVYLQGWAGPDVPLIWRFDKKVAGSGAHGDLNAHIIDMARFITGEEVAEVSGAATATFVKERTMPTVGPAGLIAAG